MADTNVDKASVDLRRYRERYADLKRQIKVLEAEAESVATTMMNEAERLGLLEEGEGYSEAGTTIVLPSPDYGSAIIGELRKRKLWQCMTIRPKASAIDKAVEDGKLPEEVAAKHRKERAPYIMHREPKSTGDDD